MRIGELAGLIAILAIGTAALSVLMMAMGVALDAIEANAGTDVATGWCAEMGGELEHRLPDGAGIDCLTPDVAWEVDPGERWAEAMGQALYYAVASGRDAGIALYGGSCAHRLRLWAALSAVAGVDVRVVDIDGPRCDGFDAAGGES